MGVTRKLSLKKNIRQQQQKASEAPDSYFFSIVCVDKEFLLHTCSTFDLV